MKLTDLRLRDLLPIFMRRDEFDVALADALSKPLQVFARECRKLSTFDALDALSEAELDALAEELNILWYDRGLSIEQKRALIAQSDLVYMRLGSKAAVDMVVDTVFGDAIVQEFWDYAGRPHYFRIVAERLDDITDEKEAKLLRLLDIVTRRSQWLECIVVQIFTDVHLRIGCMAAVRASYTTLVDTWQDNPALPATHAGGSAEIHNDETLADKPL